MTENLPKGFSLENGDTITAALTIKASEDTATHHVITGRWRSPAVEISSNRLNPL